MAEDSRRGRRPSSPLKRRLAAARASKGPRVVLTIRPSNGPDRPAERTRSLARWADAALILVGLDLPGDLGAGRGAGRRLRRRFKLLVAAYGLAREPVYTEELVAVSGRVYQFASDTHEVVVIEPARSRVDLLDLEPEAPVRGLFGQLDEGLPGSRATLARAIRSREKTGKRADAVEAEMTRDLAEPRFAGRRRPGGRPGPPDQPLRRGRRRRRARARPARLALVGLVAGAIAKLGAFRTPNDLPPFAELEAIAALTGDRKLRPTELSYLYRLAGPPRKFRRTYRLVPEPDRPRPRGDPPDRPAPRGRPRRPLREIPRRPN